MCIRDRAFSDEMRDALRGPFNDNRQGAFLAGLPGGEESIKFGIVGGKPAVWKTKLYCIPFWVKWPCLPT